MSAFHLLIYFAFGNFLFNTYYAVRNARDTCHWRKMDIFLIFQSYSYQWSVGQAPGVRISRIPYEKVSPH